MDSFSIGNVYEINGLKTVDINVLPENYCGFDCVFCPLGRTIVKTNKIFHFEETKEFINKLSIFLDNNQLELVFIKNGESLANAEIEDVIKLIKNRDIKVRLLSNGYVLNNREYRNILQMCDEVVGELAVTTEIDFQKLQRPLEGYTLEKYLTNMLEFRKWFKGKFIFDITILKNYSDSYESVEIFKSFISKLSPDEVFFETPDEEKFKGVFQISKERLNEINKNSYK